MTPSSTTDVFHLPGVALVLALAFAPRVIVETVILVMAKIRDGV